jgi:PE family
VVAPGRDEVSQRVALTLNEVGDALTKSTGQGSTEIHEIAATLRAHTDHVVEADSRFVI